MKQHLFSCILIIVVAFRASAVVFDSDTRYSQLIIDASLYHFHANIGKVAGFAQYDEQGNLIKESESNRGFDYVPGLVAKAVLEAVCLYQDQTFAAPWFYSIQAYGDRYAENQHDGKSLDDLNACKLYFGLASLTEEGTPFANTTKHNAYNNAKRNALGGLEKHHADYAISESTSRNFAANDDYTDGWWHKNTYANEMWCDGQYMGPALLAQLLAEDYSFSGMSHTEAWSLLAKQFRMTWNKLWDDDKKLLYHAFSATPADDAAWADQDPQSLHYGVSAEFWGRAEGWYFLALADVLELMPEEHPQYALLHSYFNRIAEGLALRQDQSGCWCQLLQYDNGVVPPGCSTANYLESSATAIFTAAYLKGIRLGLFEQDYVALAQKAYKGMIEQFLVTRTGNDNDNAYSLIDCCASAGLSDTRDGTARYYLEGTDTKRITDYTEGKVLGAFILAAVEYERLYMPLLPAPSEPVSDCRCLHFNSYPNS